MKESLFSLEKLFLSLKNEQEVSNLLKDLCTPKELKSLEERWQVAQLLEKKDISYREVSNQLNVSTTTVTRVARFLNDEIYQGYKLVLNRIKNGKS